MSRSGPVLLVVLSAGLVLVGACNSSSGRVASPTTASTAPASTTTTTAPAPTTTAYAATAPQGSPDRAGSHLITAWQAGDRAAALADATTAAVEAVFARPYPAGGVQARNCSEAVAGPSFCVYRVNSGLLSLSAVSAGGGWIIQDATFED